MEVVYINPVGTPLSVEGPEPENCTIPRRRCDGAPASGARAGGCGVQCQQGRNGGGVAGEQIRCLVTGATGYIGGRLVPRLLDGGFAVRALARNPDKLSAVPWRKDVEVARGDLNDRASLEAAFDDVDVVYYLVHSMGFERISPRRSVARPRTSSRPPARRGVRHHLPERIAPGGGGTVDASVVAHQGRRDSDRLRYPRPSCCRPGGGRFRSASFEMIRHLDRLPVMTTPKWVHNKIQPIAIRDVLHYLVAAATAQVPTSREWDIGGPDVLEYGDMMQIYAEVAGLRPRHMLVLPVLTPRIAALWVGLVTPIPSGLARRSSSRCTATR